MKKKKKASAKAPETKINIPKAEHTALTSEIKSMIESSSEYQSFKEWWDSGKSNSDESNPSSDNQNNDNLQTKREEKQRLEEEMRRKEEELSQLHEEGAKKRELEKELTSKVKDMEEKTQFKELALILNEASNKDLTSLVNAYQTTVKTNPLYTTAKKSFTDNDFLGENKNSKNNKEYLDGVYNGLLGWIERELSRLEITCPKCKTRTTEKTNYKSKIEWEEKAITLSFSTSYCPRCSSQEEKRLFCSECNETLLKENNYFCYHIGKLRAWRSEKEKQERQHKPASGQKELEDKLKKPELTKRPESRPSFPWWIIFLILALIAVILIYFWLKKNKETAEDDSHDGY